MTLGGNSITEEQVEEAIHQAFLVVFSFDPKYNLPKVNKVNKKQQQVINKVQPWKYSTRHVK